MDNRATAGLMVAVTGLLAGVRLRCRQAWLEAEEQGLVRPAALPPSRSTSQETSGGGGSGYRTPDRQQTRQASVPRWGMCVWGGGWGGLWVAGAWASG